MPHALPQPTPHKPMPSPLPQQSAHKPLVLTPACKPTQDLLPKTVPTQQELMLLPHVDSLLMPPSTPTRWEELRPSPVQTELELKVQLLGPMHLHGELKLLPVLRGLPTFQLHPQPQLSLHPGLAHSDQNENSHLLRCPRCWDLIFPAHFVNSSIQLCVPRSP